MMFRDGVRSTFPRRTLSDAEIANGKERDQRSKSTNEKKVNSSKYRRESSFQVGDHVLVRNYKKSSKYDPIFLPQPYIITNVDHNTKKVTVQIDNQTLIRHPDDIKPYHIDAINNQGETAHINEGVNFDMSVRDSLHDDGDGIIFGGFEYPQTIAPPAALNIPQTHAPGGGQGLRRSERIQMQNIMRELNNGK